MGSGMTDRELLESAARAAGWEGAEFQDMSGWGEVRYGFSEALWVPELEKYVNPLVDDGDALRLARTLHMTIAHEPSRGGWSVGAIVNGEFKWLAHDDDQCRAIVLAAAAIGEKVK